MEQRELFLHARKQSAYSCKCIRIKNIVTVFGGNVMKKYGVNELRKMFLEFFESKGHLALKSFSLVPQNDKSLLLINSGMAPLKPYFTGAEIQIGRASCRERV